MSRWLVSLAAVAALGFTGNGDGGNRESRATDQTSVLLQPLRSAGATVVGPVDFRAAPAMAWLSDSTLAILDIDDQQAVIFDLDGTELRRVGRKGGGPGEFGGALTLLSNERGELAVGDVLLSRVSHFGPDLRFLRSVRLPGSPLHLLGWEGHGVVAMWAGLGPGLADPTVGYVDLETGTAAPAFTVFGADSGLAARLPGSPAPSPYLAAARVGWHTYVFAQPNEYRIVEIDMDGVVRRTFGRSDVERQLRTPDEIREMEAAFKRMLSQAGYTPPPEVRDMMNEALRAPKPHFLIPSFASDELGRLWIATLRGGRDSTELDVFASGGSFLGTVAVAHQVRALAIRLPLLAALVQREEPTFEGQSSIDVYRVADQAESGGEPDGE
ncbi:MAG: hypothetical protein GTN62_06960 [Gemmatimonadales bacterium]|nr:hypothetical protein [Gemmatimonadales bacterium]NIN11239.1 hypothetical protein [Gemmatimonadales bacterium]NIN49838.1 hypothetical protein [Gemmatimonadales bacterium]NIP07302.1 hypothetical protein [Gemmatimonadales bacterium]NIR02997.1 hypothetical protein [Gemmatimonadales bacterium]